MLDFEMICAGNTQGDIRTFIGGTDQVAGLRVLIHAEFVAVIDREVGGLGANLRPERLHRCETTGFCHRCRVALERCAERFRRNAGTFSNRRH